MEIVTYAPQYRERFVALNTAWIEENFGGLEQGDWDTFQGIEEELAQGAMIYFAVEDGVVLATCMVRPEEENTWELCKLAADGRSKRRGAGGKVFRACMDYAIAHHAEKIRIISNSKLTPALHIYEKNGFHEVPIENCEYARGDIAFEYLC